MSQPANPIVEGIERKVFGEVSNEYVSGWLDRHIYEQLSSHIRQILFKAGRLGAVYGLELDDNIRIVAKVHRKADLDHLTAVKTCQQLLANSGYPCPVPLDGPAELDSRVVVIETLLEVGEEGNAHQPQIRRAMAQALAEHIAILDTTKVPLSNLGKPPAWALYQNGPWPAPHEDLVNYSRTPPGYEWLDRIAAKAAGILRAHPRPDNIGHCDWVCQNLRFAGGKVVAAYDWDSLIAESEPVLAGLSAGAFTEGTISGNDAPTPDEVIAYLREYEAVRSQPFDKKEQTIAVAAATWVLTYNARWTLGVKELGYPMGSGSPLDALMTYGETYLIANW